MQFQAFINNGGDNNFGIAEECQPTTPPVDEQHLDTRVLIGMSIGVALSGIVGAGIGFYLCKKFRSGVQ